MRARRSENAVAAAAARTAKPSKQRHLPLPPTPLKPGQLISNRETTASPRVRGTWGVLLSAALGLEHRSPNGKENQRSKAKREPVTVPAVPAAPAESYLRRLVSSGVTGQNLPAKSVVATRRKQAAKRLTGRQRRSAEEKRVQEEAASAAAAAKSAAKATAAAKKKKAKMKKREEQISALVKASMTRDLLPTEVVNMQDRIRIKEVRTDKRLPLERRLTDAIAGFLLAQVEKRNNTPARQAELFSLRVEQIRGIFLQIPVGINGEPVPTAPADSESTAARGPYSLSSSASSSALAYLNGPPKWMEVGLQMRVETLQPPASHAASPRSRETRGTKRRTRGRLQRGTCMSTSPRKLKPAAVAVRKTKITMASPILVPVQRSGKCLVPPMDRYMYFFADPRPTAATKKTTKKAMRAAVVPASSTTGLDPAVTAKREDPIVGRVLRMFLQADPVRNILRELSDFRPLVPDSPQKPGSGVDMPLSETETAKPLG